jgi:hypothetical protein
MKQFLRFIYDTLTYRHEHQLLQFIRNTLTHGNQYAGPDPAEDLPPHVGRVLPDKDRYALVCTYTGVRPDGPICGLPATTHVLWRNGDGVRYHSATACDKHAVEVRGFGIIGEHPTADSACNLPGALWFTGPPSKCVPDDTRPVSAP